jgi:hypothetical protein
LPTTYVITDLIRTQSRGMAPSNNWVLDTIYFLVAGVRCSGFYISYCTLSEFAERLLIFQPALPVWRTWADYTVTTFKKSVVEDLEKRGFYTVPKLANK